MPKPKNLIPAVGYLRKSTKGERPDGRERQEKSLAQQKAEIIKLVRGRYEILKWFEDEGISGWKRGAKRPDFTRMVGEVKGLGAIAIVCDNIDRFSRSSFDEVQEDARELRKAGVQWIVTVSHGDYDLGKRSDIGEILKFVVAVWSAHEYSRQLGRRIVLSRRNAAEDGRRTGGYGPYGLINDGKGGLKFGNLKQMKLVRWIFEQFADHKRSIGSIAGDLNARNIPGPRGGKWGTKTIADMLRRRAYRGDFVFNAKPQGQFYTIDGTGEVVEATEVEGPGRIFEKKEAHPPLIEPELFERAQQRMAVVSKDRSRRKRAGYALTGILRCGHCGSTLYGSKPNGHVVYKCTQVIHYGNETCGYQQVREDQILPFVMKLLGQELENLRQLNFEPPVEITEPQKKRTEDREQALKDRAQLAAEIDLAENNVLLVEDSRTRASLDKKISLKRDQLEQLDAALSAPDSSSAGMTDEEYKALELWYADFYRRSVTVAIPKSRVADGLFVTEEPESDSREARVDPLTVNDLLHSLGAEVKLRWKTVKRKTKMGSLLTRHVLVSGRFRLGQQVGKFNKKDLDSSAG